MEAPVHDQVAFGAFVRRGLLGEDPHLTTFHRLYQGIEHLRGRKGCFVRGLGGLRSFGSPRHWGASQRGPSRGPGCLGVAA